MTIIIKKQIYHALLNNRDVDIDDLITKINYATEIIKKTDKSISLKVDNYFVKKTTYSRFEGMIRHLLLRRRCKNAWNISRYLDSHSISTPKPIGYIELRQYFIPVQHIFITEFINDSCNVEMFVKNKIYIQKGVSLPEFFNSIHNLIFSLWEKKIYHKDVSGKNLLTTDGKRIFIIDLDSAIIKRTILLKDKLKSLVQLYDSFCDFVDEDTLRNFILSFLPELKSDKCVLLFNQIKELQSERRIKHLIHLEKYK
ncbi:MAG TPA: lipopolysaccharide kinase InaA family protein [Candidatus Hydrogenedens sp.]|nr:lipopolysaccharide kinase InaA family protein [Candidatus Hydrogenedens sp.]HOL19774.1 lipopolysaccharide kinase InaA family protein [Candidatus Hydrogenedens sp.]HPP59513.1 lipopolysaccharide kinase InaA family protein [Candidatus Hydrogenedens sp.]